jgi:DNA repair protein RadD
VRHGVTRRSWLVFCCGIDHAHAVAAELRGRGVETGEIFGHTPHAERDAVIADYKSGKLRALVNVGVLTTGFDAPQTDLLAILRPTMSPGLFLQMCGRGMRVAEGKTNCLVLDFGGNVYRHGPLDRIKPRKKGEGGVAPVKECPECQALVFAGVAECPECHYEFPPREESGPKHDVAAGTAPLLAGDAQTRFVEAKVDHVTYHKYLGKSGKWTLRVTYWCGIKCFQEWVCIQHTGYARQKAVAWWLRRAPNSVFPESIDEAIDRQRELLTPTAIRIDTNGQFPAIVGYQFPAPAAASPDAAGQAATG